MTDYDRITIERVRHAQQKTGLPLCRGVYREYSQTTGDVIALCPLEQVLVAEPITELRLPTGYLDAFTMAVDNPHKPNLYPKDVGKTHGHEDGLAVRKEFFDD